MWDTGVIVVFIVVGIPVLAGIGSGVVHSVIKAKIRFRELQVEEQKIHLEDKLRTDELNAKILRMDDMDVSAGDISRLSEEVRQLREEMARMKQEISNRAV